MFPLTPRECTTYSYLEIGLKAEVFGCLTNAFHHWFIGLSNHLFFKFSTDDSKQNCSTKSSVLDVYDGWPFRLSCDKYMDFVYSINEGVNFLSPDYVFFADATAEVKDWLLKNLCCLYANHTAVLEENVA